MTPRPTVLYVVHNHADIRAGGVEVYAQELFTALRARPDFAAVLLARAGAPMTAIQRPHDGTLVAPLEAADDAQYLFFTESGDYDHFLGTASAKEPLLVHLDRFLQTIRPDVVHFQHTLFLGYDALRQVRNSLPRAAIVYSLHDFLPICHRNGQLLRTNNHERCDRASPRRCHECFPDLAPREFFLRERFIRAQLAHVDHFLAPSRFLLERYLDWGLPRDKLTYEPYGRAPLPGPPGGERASGARWRFGFFGQMSLFKGLHLLLESMRLLECAAPGAAHLWVHGNNVDLQPPAHRERIARLLRETAPSVSYAGPFQRDEVRLLMANVDWIVVPSIWWENSPLVIQEAFQCGRPVICGDVGGMAEAVVPERTGLHFRTGDARSLAETLQRAATTPGLWDALRAQLPAVYPAAAHADVLVALYQRLIRQKHDSA